MTPTEGGSGHRDGLETTPLLADSSRGGSEFAETTTGQTTLINSEVSSSRTTTKSQNASDDDDKPLPKLQIALLCYARLVEPIAFFSIFPFVNKMVELNGNLDPADVGIYAGLIESLFSLTQIPFMIIWGRLSDLFGRKPVLVVSLAGVSLTITSFGLAKTVPQMILFRCLSGIFAGSVVTIRTMIGEHSTQKTQARAYSWFMLTSNVGIFLGPLVGGALADPVKQYPGVFGHNKFFEVYPYSLATFVTGAFSTTAFLVAAFFIKETLVQKVDSNVKPATRPANVSATTNDAMTTAEPSNSEPAPPTSMWSLFMYPGVRPVLYVLTQVSLLGTAYTALAPLFFYEPVSLGGFGFSELQISLVMGLTGLAQSIWLVAIFPPLQRKIGTVGVLRGCADVWSFLFIVCPLLNLLLRLDTNAARTAFWILAPIGLSLGVGVSMAFTAMQLAVNDVAPSPQTLGTLSGLSLAVQAAVRAVAPVATTNIYAWGVKKKILGGQLAWAVLVIFACGLAIAVRWLLDKPTNETKAQREQEHSVEAEEVE